MHTFPGERSLAERMHDLETGGTIGGIQTVEVAEGPGGILGALKMQPMTQHMGGAALPMMGLAAVGVAPWARRRGVGAMLCRHALRRGRERGDVLSALYPFRPDFYRRLGWALAGELHVYRFPPEYLQGSQDPPVRLATTADEPAIMACYARVAAKSNGLIDRSDRVWRRHLDMPATYAFVHETGGALDGYMLLRYGRSAGGREHRTLLIREMVVERPEVATALFGWISLQRDLWRRARHDATPDEHFWMRLCDPRPPGHRGTRWLWDPVARIIRGPMLRVLNVADAIERRRTWGSAAPLRFSLSVRDAELPENETQLTVDFDGTRASVSEHDRATDTRIETEIGTFSQIYAGEISVSAAVSLGAAHVTNDIPALDDLFRPSAAFRLLDEF